MESSERWKAEEKRPVRLIDLTVYPPEGRMQALIGLLEDTDLGERREHPRKPYFTAVDYASEGRSYRDFVRDIALGGLFIETNEGFAVGRLLSLILPVPDSSKPLKVTCQVARQTPTGVGVRFRLDSPEQRNELERLLERLEE